MRSVYFQRVLGSSPRSVLIKINRTEPQEAKVKSEGKRTIILKCGPSGLAEDKRSKEEEEGARSQFERRFTLPGPGAREDLDSIIERRQAATHVTSNVSYYYVNE